MIDGILLAAGLSERFGSNKLLYGLEGRPLIVHTLSACLASRLGSLHVVVGHDQALIRSAVESVVPTGKHVAFVVNPNPGRGLMSSVKCGLSTLADRTEGAMIILGDMPYLRSSDIDRLIDVFEREQSLVVATAKGRHAHPRVIPRSFFARFAALRDDEKGTRIFEEERVVKVALADPRSARDVDVPDDIA
jgi:molybdenum cofactor cytidylyltransferase